MLLSFIFSYYLFVGCTQRPHGHLACPHCPTSSTTIFFAQHPHMYFIYLYQHSLGQILGGKRAGRAEAEGALIQWSSHPICHQSQPCTTSTFTCTYFTHLLHTLHQKSRDWGQNWTHSLVSGSVVPNMHTCLHSWIWPHTNPMTKHPALKMPTTHTMLDTA